MTQKQALAKAVKLFGKNAAIKKDKCFAYGWPSRKPWVLTPRATCHCDDHPKPCPRGVPVFKVGSIQLGMMFVIEGEGATWEGAFADVAKRKERDLERAREAVAR